jgi:hypothetical protein
MEKMKMDYISLYILLSSNKTIVREFHPINIYRPLDYVLCIKMIEPYTSSVMFKHIFMREMLYKATLKKKLSLLPIDQRLVRTYGGDPALLYSFEPWSPIAAKMSQLPFQNGFLIGRRKPLLLFQDRKPGLADITNITRETSRIKSFRLVDAIMYSYFRDIRFLLVLCLALGFSIWWALAPEPLLLKPIALSSPNVSYLYNAVMDTYYTKVCISHPNMSLPCECGSPINSEVKELFPEPSFDPLLIDKGNAKRMGALAAYFGCILVALALSESASHQGIYLNL